MNYQVLCLHLLQTPKPGIMNNFWIIKMITLGIYKKHFCPWPLESEAMHHFPEQVRRSRLHAHTPAHVKLRCSPPCGSFWLSVINPRFCGCHTAICMNHRGDLTVSAVIAKASPKGWAIPRGDADMLLLRGLLTRPACQDWVPETLRKLHKQRGKVSAVFQDHPEFLVRHDSEEKMKKTWRSETPNTVTKENVPVLGWIAHGWSDSLRITRFLFSLR